MRHGIIGNCAYSALLQDGSIEWMCWPRLDSSFVFGPMLDEQRGGAYVVEMVDADLGITFLPAMAAGSALLRNTKVRLYPLGEKSYRNIGLAWRKGSSRAEEFSLLGELLSANRHRPDR